MTHITENGLVFGIHTDLLPIHLKETNQLKTCVFQRRKHNGPHLSKDRQLISNQTNVPKTTMTISHIWQKLKLITPSDGRNTVLSTASGNVNEYNHFI